MSRAWTHVSFSVLRAMMLYVRNCSSQMRVHAVATYIDLRTPLTPVHSGSRSCSLD